MYYDVSNVMYIYTICLLMYFLFQESTCIFKFVKPENGAKPHVINREIVNEIWGDLNRGTKKHININWLI